MNYTREERFKQHVLSPYQIYNSIFMTLPFDAISSTGVLLPLFKEVCEKGFEKLEDPTTIVDRFFEKYTDLDKEQDRINLLFRFIQYIERQVVLFDAIEDAAFPIIHNMDGRGTLRGSKEEARERNKLNELKAYLKEFKVRPVLTAHPTQFYPGTVLGIITDLAIAIEENDLEKIKKFLGQLGKTPFFKKEKPSPYDEAVRLIWYLEQVFYPAAGRIYGYIQDNIFEGATIDNEVVQLGFWPGGDRDGNPFVTTEITLNVAHRLRNTLLKNYHRDLRQIRRRLTFKGVYEQVEKLENRVHEHLQQSGKASGLSSDQILATLESIRTTLVEDHQSLFIDLVNDLINKVRMFGLYFASLDIRQDSRVHQTVMEAIAKAHPDLLPEGYGEGKTEEVESEEVYFDVGYAKVWFEESEINLDEKTDVLADLDLNGIVAPLIHVGRDSNCNTDNLPSGFTFNSGDSFEPNSPGTYCAKIKFNVAGQDYYVNSEPLTVNSEANPDDDEDPEVTLIFPEWDETIYDSSRLTYQTFLTDTKPLSQKKLTCRWIKSSANSGTLMAMWDF